MPKKKTSVEPALSLAHRCTQRWFASSFASETMAQRLGWPPIARGESTLLLAPTGSGKTLAAFLIAIDKLLFGKPAESPGVRVLYVSPLKALAIDVERNLRAPLAGIRARAEREEVPYRPIRVGIRSGDTPPRERAAMKRHPPDVLITTPESLYLLLTSDAAKTLTSVETVIVDEIHSVVPTKRGAHLALTLERLETIRQGGASPLQRIGLSATQRPLDEVARFLGGHGLDERAADNLLRYLKDQVVATGKVPSDRGIVIERFLDDIGDWCVCVLTPFGSRVHAPWATAVKATLLAERGIEADLVYADDGMVFRLPESDAPPPDSLFFPDAAEVERIVTDSLSETALFAARFRENAGRALLLPRRRPGQRTPLSSGFIRVRA